ncbi:diguanylate cyclase [Parasulfuritortus cantonensis]|uniref:Diguanylate cyclase n=1 Tax=Parasulfuritortus cantonensis TaxID=2528202 RepID=A0A4R1B852_9PROT|nr:diguanylate cyclase [Parasulfuritortus cantonensis]TCJ13457.1 diguanylate cyclase [Parasulfuritortus cantonensis]
MLAEPARKFQSLAMAEPRSQQRLPKRLSRLLVVGFAVLIGLMSVLVLNSVLNLRAQEARVAGTVELRNRKIELATDLLMATYSRHNSLVYQTIVGDPFEQDDHFQQFIKWGYEVGKARNALRAMRLDGFETARLADQDALLARIVELHDRISDLARQGRAEQARQLIAVDLRPDNLKFIDSVDQLEHYERDRIQAELDAARSASRRAIFVAVGLGSAIVLLACAIAYLTYRQMGRYADTIDEQMRALEQHSAQLKHEATHDPLTGLANRSLFYHRLTEALTRAGQDQLKATVLYVDLDDFKPVNDRYGHAVGDSLLQVVAGRLLGSVRTTDTVARLGGDEFAVILLGVGEASRISRFEEAIRANLVRPFEIDGAELVPSCSCGHAVYPDDGVGMDTLLHAADERMYAAKRARKGGAAG